MKKILQILALPVVLAAGYAMALLVLLVLAGLVVLYVIWLVDINLDGPMWTAAMLNLATLVGIVLVARSKRVRIASKEVWKQLSNNL